MNNKNIEEITVNNCINIITIEGFLTSDVKLSFCEEKKVYKATFHLKNPNKVGKKVYFNELYVVVYGKQAKECKRVLETGDYCTVSGKICMWTTNNENCFGVTVNAYDVYWNKKR